MIYLENRIFLLRWAAVITLVFGLFFVAVQQSLRLGANEPQASMGQDIAKKLQDGKAPQDIVFGQINIATDTAPFIIIYDQFGKVRAGNGYLNGTVPQVPIGVLAATHGHKINAVTWQPEGNIRIASVSVQAGTSYVLAGRSLYVIENKISAFGKWLAAGWVAAMALLIAAYRFIYRSKPKHIKESTQ
jgi:hypothetical protein